ncbi:hypothetical protein [Massilia sp. CCM 8734]|uniref:hypothetical protein n=1 Tax=Massilia sp. CCM 8734 TaxID=2609283 RepID=UPI0014223F17|nr:hypothetical protein [Massilia sp. CCM 8734]NHZ94572.1 hypothetical protein [Massilia sp. CCM 8734]
MGFAEKHLQSLGSSNLMDDCFHHQTDALQAAARADKSARNIGSLLSRVKYADGTLGKKFEGNAQNLAGLLREWLAIVTEKGTARRWVKPEDIAIAPITFRRVANASLAHFLDGKCAQCHGTGVAESKRACIPCKGSGKIELTGLSGYEAKLVLDMVSELGAIESTHAAIASALLRKHDLVTEEIS